MTHIVLHRSKDQSGCKSAERYRYSIIVRRLSPALICRVVPRLVDFSVIVNASFVSRLLCTDSFVAVERFGAPCAEVIAFFGGVMLHYLYVQSAWSHTS